MPDAYDTPSPAAPLVPGTITAQPNAAINTAEKMLVQIISDIATAINALNAAFR
jgi:hypothetical protein